MLCTWGSKYLRINYNNLYWRVQFLYRSSLNTITLYVIVLDTLWKCFIHIILKTLQDRYSRFMNTKTGAEGFGTQGRHRVAEQWLAYSPCFIPGKTSSSSELFEGLSKNFWVLSPDAELVELTQNFVVLYPLRMSLMISQVCKILDKNHTLLQCTTGWQYQAFLQTEVNLFWQLL